MTPLTVAWISDFPLEWMPNMPEPIPHLPKDHPATWEMALLGEFQKNPQIRLHIIALRKGISRSFSFQRHGATFHVLKYFGGMRGPSLFWTDTLLIGRELRRIKPDVVQAWGNERGAGLVASRLPWPCLVTVQGLFSYYREKLPDFPGAKLSAWAERTSLSRARHASGESSFVVDYLLKAYPHLTVHHVEHVPDSLFAAIRRQPARNPIRFVTNGTIGYRKGTDLFLKALAALLDQVAFEALIIGSPNPQFIEPLRQSLPARLWDRVTFRSGLTPPDVARELETATIFVMPSRADTGPMAVKEAVLAGVPVVASKLGGTPDYIASGNNGLLFQPDSLADLTAVLQAAVHHPMFSTGAIAPGSSAHARQALSPRAMAAAFCDAYMAARG